MMKKFLLVTAVQLYVFSFSAEAASSACQQETYRIQSEVDAIEYNCESAAANEAKLQSLLETNRLEAVCETAAVWERRQARYTLASLRRSLALNTRIGHSCENTRQK